MTSPSSSPNPDQNIKLRNQIDALIGDLGQNPIKSDIHDRVGKISEGIQKLGDQLNSESKQLIQRLKDKLIEIERPAEAKRLDDKIQAITKPVSWQKFGDLSRDIRRNVLSFLSPKELLARTKEFGKLATEVAIEKINRDRVPLRELGLEPDELGKFISDFGFKLECLYLNGLDSESLIYICNSLHKIYNVKELDLTAVISMLGVKRYYLHAFFQKLPLLENLKYLNFSGNELDRDLFPIVIYGMEKLTKLERLNFNGVMTKIMPHSQYITPEQATKFLHLLEKFPLKELHLRRLGLTTDDFLLDVAKVLSLPKLEFLDLSHVFYNMNYFKIFLDHLKQSADRLNFESLTLEIGDLWQGGNQYEDITSDLIEIGQVLKNFKNIVIYSEKNPAEYEKEAKEANIQLFGANPDGTPVKELFRSRI